MNWIEWCVITFELFKGYVLINEHILTFFWPISQIYIHTLHCHLVKLVFSFLLLIIHWFFLSTLACTSSEMASVISPEMRELIGYIHKVHIEFCNIQPLHAHEKCHLWKPRLFFVHDISPVFVCVLSCLCNRELAYSPQISNISNARLKLYGKLCHYFMYDGTAFLLQTMICFNKDV